LLYNCRKRAQEEDADGKISIVPIGGRPRRARDSGDESGWLINDENLYSTSDTDDEDDMEDYSSGKKFRAFKPKDFTFDIQFDNLGLQLAFVYYFEAVGLVLSGNLGNSQ
jgi:hypothetical protein